MFRPRHYGSALSAAALLLTLVSAVSLWPARACAEESASPRQAFDAARNAARAALERGPVAVTLRDQAKLDLPEGFGFIPQKQAAALMNAMGNRTGADLLGLIVPLGAHTRWLVVATYNPSGYIKDDDAQHWDAEKLLQSLKDGTEAGNAERAKVGLTPLKVTRWIEPPAYTADTHRLIWSAEALRKDGVTEDPTINYNTYVLGREGYISLNLITSGSELEADKDSAGALLSAVSFNDGKRYGDFNSSTDKVAAYGLAALVAGVAAKKLGLLALLAATVVKFAKVIGLAIVGVVVAVRKWLGMGRKQA